MIIGVDVGNYSTKTSEYISFLSRCSTLENRYKETTSIKRNEKIYIEEGTFDTEYRKVKKEHYIDFLLAAIYKSSRDIDNQIVVGLPLSQYKTDKEELKNLIMSCRINDIEINGKPVKIIISDVEVFAEGIAAVAGTNFQGIIIDIGGRTTDMAMVEGIEVKKIINPFSVPLGTLNLYTDFIKAINAKYSLDLKLSDCNRILSRGLTIDGERKDLNFAMEVFKIYIDDIVKILQLEYSIRTNDVLCIGGGAELLCKPLKKRMPQAELVEDAFYANALGYLKVGENLWL